MARKAASNSGTHRGFADIVGVVLLASALLLLVAQLSFDRNDLSINRDPPNKPAHNWIGPLGAQTAGWEDFPTVVRLVDRGDPFVRPSDIGAMELYGTPIVGSDPYDVIAAIRGA